MSFPKTLGECIDQAYRARSARLKVEKEHEKIVKKLKEAEVKIADYIINNFEKSSIESAKGKLATAAKRIVTHANIIDWEKFTTWVAKTKSWDMMTKKCNDKAYKARLEDKKVVPGVESFNEVKLSLTKR